MPSQPSTTAGALRRLVSDSAAYGLGGTANQAVAILLVPIYARVLGPSGTGIIAIVNTTLSLALMVASLALPQAFFRWYLQESEDDQQRAHVLATTMAVRLVASVAGALIMVALVIPLVYLLYGDGSLLPIFLLIGPILFFDSVLQIPLSFLRAQRRPRSYVLITITRASLGSLLIVVLVVVARLGIAGVVIGSAIAAAVAAGVALVSLRREGLLRLNWDGALVRSMLLFSLPLVPAAAAGWTLNLSDRYILQAFTDAASVGVYSTGYTVGLVINALAVQPFTLSWSAAYWEMGNRDGAPLLFSRVMTAFAAAAGFLALGLSALGTDAVRILLGRPFEAARYVVPFSAFAYVIYGLYAISSTGLNLTAQTRWLPLTMGIAAVTSVILSFALIPVIGVLGAAVATLVSYGVLAILTGIMSQRYYPVPWDLPRVGAVLAIGLGLAAIALLGPDTILWRLAAFLAYVPLIFALRIVRLSDVRAVLKR